MTTVLLITFEYTKEKYLPGSIIDLYHAYNYFSLFDYDIHVITDIEDNKRIKLDGFQEEQDYGIVDEDVLTFFPKIPKSVAKNKETFLSLLRIPSLNKSSKIIIYYSGHGIEENVVLPNEETVLFISLRDIISRQIAKDGEIFWILDCCNPLGLHLPYKLTKNKFILVSHSKIEFALQKMLVIASSDAGEKSMARKSGSMFSRFFFQILHRLSFSKDAEEKNRNLDKLVREIMRNIEILESNYVQTVSLYSSYIIHPVLWSWIGNNSGCVIESDNTLTTLILSSNK